jgi:hypothetical protein
MSDEVNLSDDDDYENYDDDDETNCSSSILSCMVYLTPIWSITKSSPSSFSSLITCNDVEECIASSSSPRKQGIELSDLFI